MTSCEMPKLNGCLKRENGVGSKPMTINFSGMNIYLPAILKLRRYQGFDPQPNDLKMMDVFFFFAVLDCWRVPALAMGRFVHEESNWMSFRISSSWVDSWVVYALIPILILIGGLEHFFIFPYIENNHPN